jgi:hypothetical protein
MASRAPPFIDETLIPRSEWEERSLDRCRRNGLSIFRVRPGSDAVRVVGPGVDVLADSLCSLSKHDLKPANGTTR